MRSRLSCSRVSSNCITSCTHFWDSASAAWACAAAARASAAAALLSASSKAACTAGRHPGKRRTRHSLH
eukprot:1158559-Pelagomonas_calceolata.AAC.5